MLLEYDIKPQHVCSWLSSYHMFPNTYFFGIHQEFSTLTELPSHFSAAYLQVFAIEEFFHAFPMRLSHSFLKIYCTIAAQ